MTKLTASDVLQRLEQKMADNPNSRTKYQRAGVRAILALNPAIQGIKTLDLAVPANVDQIADSYTRRSSAAESTLKGYTSAFRGAINDIMAESGDPFPDNQYTETDLETDPEPVPHPVEGECEVLADTVTPTRLPEAPALPVEFVTYPILIRPGLQATFTVPIDLSAAEAAHITRMVQAVPRDS